MTTHQHVPLSTRLARYGLEKMEGELKKLNIKRGEAILDPTDKRHAERIRRLKTHSVHDLKRWMGVPDGAIGQNAPAPLQKAGFIPSDSRTFQPFPTVRLIDRDLSAHLVSYLLHPTPENPSTGEKQIISSLDEAIRKLGIELTIFLAADVHIEENTTLVVDPKIQILFANAIVLEDNASLRMQSTGARIDCARLHFVHS
jgi:hypothetical protein